MKQRFLILATIVAIAGCGLAAAQEIDSIASSLAQEPFSVVVDEVTVDEPQETVIEATAYDDNEDNHAKPAVKARKLLSVRITTIPTPRFVL